MQDGLMRVTQGNLLVNFLLGLALVVLQVA
jgi:hypothetical protein